MPGLVLRRLAAWLLRAGIRLAPHDAHEWGNAMLCELRHVEGDWAAVGWALGGVGVLVKKALIALLLPARDRQAAPVGNPLLREAKMHKASMITGGACLAAAILFFLAPVFRQAFRVSLAQWQNVIHVEQSLRSQQPELESFARRVEKDHDAEGMAFVAARLHGPAESVRLADEAVRLNPKLIWIWGIVGSRHSDAPGVPGWVRKLEQWDPGNALPYLILAECEDIEHAGSGVNSLHPQQPTTAWMDAMAGAFNSERIDDYTDRLRVVDRAVAIRYRLSDPSFILEGESEHNLPSYAVADSAIYAKLTMAAGDVLEVRGDLKGAIEKYLKVAHFLRLLDSHTDYSFFVDREMPDLYRRLGAAYKRLDNGPQSTYFVDLALTATYDLEQGRHNEESAFENRLSVFGVIPWNALVVELSNVAMLASFCLLLITLIIVFTKSKTLKPGGLRMGPVATALGFLGSVGLLISSVTLYVAYRPYAAIYTRFLQTGDTSQLKILREFLEFTRTPVGTQIYRFTPMPHGPALFGPYISVHAFAFYFWLAVTVLGLASLVAIGGWHLLRRFRPHAGAAA
jgi:hypothetical protein